MTNLLVKWFVRDADRVQDAPVRTAYGQLAGTVGILCNLLLFAGKFAVGTAFGSLSITADAMNNLSDASGNGISLLGFRLAALKPDANHPYGHGRFEYLASLAVSVLIVSIGLNLLGDSVDKILHPAAVAFSWLSVGVLAVSILVKLWLSRFNRVLGQRIQSDTLLAAAADSRSDVLSTLGVLAGAFLVKWTGLPVLDGILGFLVAGLILWGGGQLVMQTLSPLLGETPDPALVQQIRDRVMAYPGVLGTHDLMVHDYGPGHQFATLHVEVPAETDILAAHELMDQIEQDFLRRDGLQVTIHYDPIVTADPRVQQLRAVLSRTLADMDPALTLHDLRMVPGQTQINVLFDLVTPAGYAGDREALLEALRRAARAVNPAYCCHIKLEQSYI